MDWAVSNFSRGEMARAGRVLIDPRGQLDFAIGRGLRRASCLLLSLVGLTSPSAQTTPLQSPATPVSDVTQTEWSQRWWQWAGGFEQSESPISDMSGAKCQAGQQGKVWFLAGTYGSRRVERTCKIPAGRYLFFPLVNYVVFRGPTSGASCEALMRTARSMTDEPSFLMLELDGRSFDRLEDHRHATSGCFQVPNFPVPAAANGYYVMLAPLPRGKHVINFGGTLPRLSQAVTYTLEVE